MKLTSSGPRSTKQPAPVANQKAPRRVGTGNPPAKPATQRDRTTVSGEEGRGAEPGHLEALLRGFGGPPPRRPDGPPKPSPATNIPSSPTLDRISSKMKAARRGENRWLNSFRPQDAARVDELRNFARQAPVTTTDPLKKEYQGMPPRDDSSHFATRVKDQQKQLADWILGQSDKARLDPADIYKKSLELNQGDAFNANLTAHNLMKDVTASERGAGSPEIRQRDSQIENRLINLREPNDPNRSEKMGPWYHFFGLGVAGAAANGASLGVVRDGAQRAFDEVPRSGTDPGKTATDAWAARAFRY